MYIFMPCRCITGSTRRAEASMRLSVVQKQTLLILYQFSLNRRQTVPQRTILHIIYERSDDIYPNSFRASCIRLNGLRLMVQESGDSNRKWLSLTGGSIKARALSDTLIADVSKKLPNSPD